MRLLPVSVLLLASLLSAQTLVTTPSTTTANVDRPFAGGVGRYQQWYAAWTLSGPGQFTTPVRIDQMEFFAGLSQSSTQTTIDMEVTISHGLGFGLLGTFASNLVDPLVVLPRQNVTLFPGAPSALVMTIPFATQFTWDRTRPIVIDIKIFGNGMNNQPFTYNHLGTASGLQAVARNYQAGNPSAVSGVVQQSVGLITRFRGRSGFVLEYGSGCAGEGSFVPDNTVLNLPWPGIGWGHQLTGAASQRFAMWMIGDSRTTFGSFLLPADVGTMLGFAPNGCMMRQNAVASLWTTTVGGGPGAGFASINVNLPAVGWYIGMSLYTQWFVLDPNSPNGLMSATEGAWSVVAPVGG